MLALAGCADAAPPPIAAPPASPPAAPTDATSPAIVVAPEPTPPTSPVARPSAGDGEVDQPQIAEVAPDPAPDPAEVLAEASRRAVARATPDADEPAHLRIPAIGVDTATIDLDLTAATAEVPESFHVAGWYRQTPTPGTTGPAVVVGHVGSRHGPGVFARLDQLRAGDEVLVTDDGGVTRTFVVDHGELVDKYDRPPEVFGWGEDRPELRLITCGGDFDPGRGHHVSNYVVWAHEVGT